MTVSRKLDTKLVDNYQFQLTVSGIKSRVFSIKILFFSQQDEGKVEF